MRPRAPRPLSSTAHSQHGILEPGSERERIGALGVVRWRVPASAPASSSSKGTVIELDPAKALFTAIRARKLRLTASSSLSTDRTTYAVKRRLWTDKFQTFLSTVVESKAWL